MYKLSKYNYILTNFPETAILFNGLTKKFFLIKREKLAQYVNLLNSFQDLVDIPTPHLALLQKMISAGFIVKENVDEFQQVRKREHDFFETKEYQTIIIPTYDCNYSCWYCTQKHQPTELQDINVERIKKHIVSYIEQNNILTYHLCWFGGEPLMQKNRVVEISNDLYQYCLVNNIEFCGQITTNGALLDEKLIRQLSSVKIDRYQITIDAIEKIIIKQKR